jgi:hypothetical protein
MRSQAAAKRTKTVNTVLPVQTKNRVFVCRLEPDCPLNVFEPSIGRIDDG